MADLQVGNQHGVTAVGGTGRTNINGGTAENAGWESDNLDTIAAMRTRLAAIDGALYTADYLNAMTYNDMVYAIRLADAAATVR